MDQTTQETPGGSFLELHLDQQSVLYLGESARWARFLAILGFIYIGLLLLISLFAGALVSNMMSGMGTSDVRDIGYFSTGFVTIIILAAALILFFPVLYLYNYATKLRRALRNNEQAVLTESLKNLKSFFKFYGILAIIVISLYILMFIGGIIGALMVHRA